jgi:hypothetical protein
MLRAAEFSLCGMHLVFVLGLVATTSCGCIGSCATAAWQLLLRVVRTPDPMGSLLQLLQQELAKTAPFPVSIDNSWWIVCCGT